MWSFKSVLCTKECDLKSCKDLSDYIQNVDKCRGTAAVHRYTTKLLSFIPFTGISNFYSGNKFSAVFEVIEGVTVVFLIFCCCCCCCSDTLSDHEKQHLLAFGSLWSILITAINIVRYVICDALAGSFELNYEFSLMVTSLVISIISCLCGWGDKRCWIITTFINIIVIGVMEVARDVYMASNSENDGYGCPFIETWE